MANINPLSNFQRRSRFSLNLPSRGKWHIKSSITTNSYVVDVLPMTAPDETKFKLGDAALTGSSLFDIIRSCIPTIKQPELIPMCDLDAILLAVRAATYGDTIEFTVKVPNTSLTRTLTLTASGLIEHYFGNSEKWDERLDITDETTGTIVTVIFRPMNLKTLFTHSRTMIKLQQLGSELTQAADVNDDEKLESLSSNIVNVSQVNISMLTDSIESLSSGEFTTSNPQEIKRFVEQLDVEYFNAMQTHLDQQRSAIGLQPVILTSTDDEVSAGAPETWIAEINFVTAGFFR